MKKALGWTWYILCLPGIAAGVIVCWTHGSFLHGVDIADAFVDWLKD